MFPLNRPWLRRFKLAPLQIKGPSSFSACHVALQVGCPCSLCQLIKGSIFSSFVEKIIYFDLFSQRYVNVHQSEQIVVNDGVGILNEADFIAHISSGTC